MENSNLPNLTSGVQPPKSVIVIEEPPGTQLKNSKPTQLIKLSFIMLLIGIIVISAFYIFITKINFTKNKNDSGNLISSNNPSQSPSPNLRIDVTEKSNITEPEGIKWITHTENDFGFSFEIPSEWNFVSGRSNKSVDFDILSPDKQMLVGIYVGTDDRITKGMEMASVLDEKEAEIKSSENYRLTNVDKYSKVNEVGYIASGETWFLNFSNENAMKEEDIISYDFQEKVSIYSDGRTILLRSMVLPNSNAINIAKHIVDSFKWK